LLLARIISDRRIFAAENRAERSSSRAQITQFWFAFWFLVAVVDGR